MAVARRPIPQKQQRTIGWLYDAALRGELTRRLGVTWERQPDLPEDGPADMTCIPEAVREVLSERSAQVKAKHDELIRRWSEENDGAQPDRETIARLERSVAVTSRPSKQHGTDPMTLHDTWRNQARTAGLDPDRLTPDRLDRRPRASGIGDPMLIAESLHHVAEESSTWLAPTSPDTSPSSSRSAAGPRPQMSWPGSTGSPPKPRPSAQDSRPDDR